MDGGKNIPYENGWAALTKLMQSGRSWSGHERNCAYVNVGGTRFADVSAAVGLDFLDDGRSLAVTDWDGDGDLDIWFKSRTGPQLRLMRNRGVDRGHFVQLKLSGKSCNRDAIGATAIVTVNGRQIRRDVVAGDGYLSQSSKRLHFGLGSDTTGVKLTVRWPGGTEQVFDAVRVDRRYELVQGGSLVETPARQSPSLTRGGLTPPQNATGARIVLRTPLPLSPGFLASVTGSATTNQAMLVNLWAQWCAPCRAELNELAEYADSFENDHLRIIPVNVDEPANRSKASKMLAEIAKAHGVTEQLTFRTADETALELIDVILTHVREKTEDQLPLPVSLLIDKSGLLQIVYLGRLGAGLLMADHLAFNQRGRGGAFRGAFPGRWYFGVPRNVGGLAATLKARGLETEAKYYRRLSAAQHALQGR